jgi:ElaB/YqjD/DUF883 family membrane-anchored ribosome-binding protein
MATANTINRPDRPDTPRNRGDDDAPHFSPVTPSEDMRTIMINRVSWGAVLAGVALALVVQLLINMVGVGIGMATLDPGTNDNPSAANFSITAAIWWLISGIIAAFIGGYAAGRLAGKPRESTAGWHGLITWAATTLVIVYLLTSAIGGLVGGAFRTLTSTVSGAAGVATAVTQPTTGTGNNNAFSGIEEALRNVTGGDTGAARDAAIASVRALVTGDPAQATQAREEAAQAIAQAQNIPIDQARTQVQQYEQQYRQTVGNVTEAADTATTAVSWGALLGALGLLLGALAAWFGGRAGAVDPTITSASPALLRQRMSNRSMPAGE